MKRPIEAMLEKYGDVPEGELENIAKEIMQEIILCGLSRNHFFDHALFTGGTALRIFHGIDRFSEDLDFFLDAPDDSFQLGDYLENIRKELSIYGFSMEATEKKTEGNVKSAFIKGNTKEIILTLYPDTGLILPMRENSKIKIKLEVDVNPPSGVINEEKFLLLPTPCAISTPNLPSMFSGKLHAIIARKYTKGRDLYDFIWYMQHNVPYNSSFLENALKQTGDLDEREILDEQKLSALLKEKFSAIDYEEAKRDVLLFIKDADCLKDWNKDMFLYVMKKGIEKAQ